MRSRTMVLAALCAAQAAAAQELRGTVTDSATRLPVAGAVLLFLDAGGATVTRGITNERGDYRAVASPAMRRLRVLRLGFRPREVAIPAGDARLDVALTAVPALLERVRVTAGASCPRRSDRQAALALLDQARAGLLTAVVAREANPASIVRLGFERTMDGTSDRIERQVVRIDSTGRSTVSFQAVRSAADFVRLGFAYDSAQTQVYLGPDAETLLDDRFAAGYCFHIRGPARDRANQVGLAFLPAERRRNRVDVDGTLWIDTVARQLRDIDFRYLGMPSGTEGVRPGGSVSFLEMPNGVVIVDRWFFRLPAATFDTNYSREGRPLVRRWIYARHTGGEIASAAWPDGLAWKAPLGTLRARAVDWEGKAVTDAVIRLPDTDYLASPDLVPAVFVLPLPTSLFPVPCSRLCG